MERQTPAPDPAPDPKDQRDPAPGDEKPPEKPFDDWAMI